MKKNTKIILTSLALLASASVLAPSAVVSAADQPATNVAATTATSQNSDLQTITMTITKTGSTTPSEAAMFLGNSAQVNVKDGKVTEVIIHVDGSKAPMTKGQDMSKMVASLTLNGVAGKQENVAKDGSSLDYVFSADAYKEGAGSLEFGLNVMGKTMGKTMNEKADITLGKVAEDTANKDANTTSDKTQTDAAAAKKTAAKKAKAVKRTLKHNAYVYKKNGKRANKKVLKKGHRVNTYGRAIKLHGKTFYRISKNTYVKKANF